MAAHALARIEPPHPLHGFEIAAGKDIDGPYGPRAPRTLDALYCLDGRIQVLRRVELIPDRTAASFHHFVDGMISFLNAAQNLQSLLLLRGARHSGRSLGMKQSAA